MNQEQRRMLAQQVQPVVEEARQAILAVYHSGLFETEEKSDHSPVTAADRASHGILMDGLRPVLADVPIISEESRHADQVTHGSLFWLVDPLDGTKEFIRRSGEFTINIALVDGSGVPIWGMVDVPLAGTTYYGGDGEVLCRDAQGVRALPPLEMKDASEEMTVALSRSHQGAADDWLREHGIRPKRLVYSGSAVKFCWVAEGRVDLYVRLRPTMGWDTAAGQALVEAAGGGIRDLDGNPLRYRPRAEVNPYFIAFRPLTDEPRWAQSKSRL